MKGGLQFKTLRPLLNRVLVQKPEATKVSKGGIILKKEEENCCSALSSLLKDKPFLSFSASIDERLLRRK